MQEMQVWSLSREHPLEKEMATCSSILAWRIPWAEKPVGLQSMALQRVRHNWVTKHTHTHTHTHSLAHAATAAAKLLQSCPTLCNPIDSSPPGSPVPGILQARTLEWVAISFSSAWKWKVKVKSFSRVRLLAIPWTTAYQAPPPMGFSRQECWSGVPLPSPWPMLQHLSIKQGEVKCVTGELTNIRGDKEQLSACMLFSSRD